MLSTLFNSVPSVKYSSISPRVCVQMSKGLHKELFLTFTSCGHKWKQEGISCSFRAAVNPINVLAVWVILPFLLFVLQSPVSPLCSPKTVFKSDDSSVEKAQATCCSSNKYRKPILNPVYDFSPNEQRLNGSYLLVLPTCMPLVRYDCEAESKLGRDFAMEFLLEKSILLWLVPI